MSVPFRPNMVTRQKAVLVNNKCIHIKRDAPVG